MKNTDWVELIRDKFVQYFNFSTIDIKFFMNNIYNVKNLLTTEEKLGFFEKRTFNIIESDERNDNIDTRIGIEYRITYQDMIKSGKLMVALEKNSKRYDGEAQVVESIANKLITMKFHKQDKPGIWLNTRKLGSGIYCYKLVGMESITRFVFHIRRNGLRTNLACVMKTAADITICHDLQGKQQLSNAQGFGRYISMIRGLAINPVTTLGHSHF